MAFFHMAGTVPVLQDSLKSFNNVLLVSSPKFFIMSFVTPSGPGAFLHFNCLIASSTSSILIASVIQQRHRSRKLLNDRFRANIVAN